MDMYIRYHIVYGVVKNPCMREFILDEAMYNRSRTLYAWILGNK